MATYPLSFASRYINRYKEINSELFKMCELAKNRFGENQYGMAFDMAVAKYCKDRELGAYFDDDMRLQVSGKAIKELFNDKNAPSLDLYNLALRWEKSQQVYVLNDNVFDALFESTDISYVPREALEHLPFDVFACEWPSGRAQFVGLGDIHGFICMKTKTHLHIYLVCKMFNKGGWFSFPCHFGLDGIDASKGLSSLIDNSAFNGVIKCQQEDKDLNHLLSAALKCILFIVAENNDPVITYKPAGTGRKTNQETIRHLGNHIGPQLGKVIRYQSEYKAEKTNRKVAAHVVRGHFHNFWVGPRIVDGKPQKGEKLITRWVMPYIAGIGDTLVEVTRQSEAMLSAQAT